MSCFSLVILLNLRNRLQYNTTNTYIKLDIGGFCFNFMHNKNKTNKKKRPQKKANNNKKLKQKQNPRTYLILCIHCVSEMILSDMLKVKRLECQ